MKKHTFNRHREMAKDVMEKHIEARNDDMELFFFSLFQDGVHIPKELREKIKGSKINFKTLIRERQKLQKEGKFLPTSQEVIKKRRQKQIEYAENYSQNQ